MPSILIVDDNAFFRKTLKTILLSRAPSLHILEAADGIEAMEVFEKYRSLIIFLDINLPGKNGIEVMKEMKASHPDIPVVILTGYDTPEYEEAAFSSGADYFLSKRTATSVEIADVLEQILSGYKP